MSDARSDGIGRRGFIQTTAGALAAGAVARWCGEAVGQPVEGKGEATVRRAVRDAGGARSVVISSANGGKKIAAAGDRAPLEEAMRMLRAGGDPLDAVIAAVNMVEDDPTDHSVGLGGLPNEDGVVELDASVMHGPSHKAGAVAALRGIRNPSKVARLVMMRTDHVLLVGEGALRFAKAHGFKEEELLTEEAREIWLKWKESHSREDDWVGEEELKGGGEAGGEKAGAKSGGPAAVPFTWGTINCLAVDEKGNLGGVTTTSGLSYKIPGRVGDSPIIGAGLYVDNAVGAAGSTGRGEANLQNCSSFLIVELMRDKKDKDGNVIAKGLRPEAACLEAMKRVADHAEPRLRDEQGRAKFDLKFYAVNKAGEFGSASMWNGASSTFAVEDGSGVRILECASLFRK